MMFDLFEVSFDIMCGCFQSHGLSNERLIKLGNYQVIRQSKIA